MTDDPPPADGSPQTQKTSTSASALIRGWQPRTSGLASAPGTPAQPALTRYFFFFVIRFGPAMADRAGAAGRVGRSRIRGAEPQLRR